jgi:hemolysin D
MTVAVPSVLTLRRGYETEFLPAALEVMQTPASPTARLTAGLIVGVCCVALGWSILGHVDIVATAPGTVIPAGKVKVLQPLESGVVKSILVQDGDHVRAGQTLIELDVTVAAAERDRFARDLRQARLDVAALSALRRDQAADDGLAGFAPPADASDGEIEVARAGALARRAEQLAKLASLEQQIAQKQAEAEENTATIAKLRASLPLLQQKRDLYRQVRLIQGTSQVAVLEAEQAALEGEHNLAIQILHAPELEAARQSLQRQFAQQQATYTHDLLKDLSDARQHADELAQQLSAAAHKAEQTMLTAPIAGTVQQLAIHTLGGVVTPAQPLLTLVPNDAPVLIEATVANDDIGFVAAGQPVEVKVKTFPFTRYGLLHGRVRDVSRAAVRQDANAVPKPRRDNGQSDDADARNPDAPTSGYVAHVTLDRTSLDVDGHGVALAPGMEITAEIKTGRRRVISYLLSPLQRYAHDAMEER